MRGIRKYSAIFLIIIYVFMAEHLYKKNSLIELFSTKTKNNGIKVKILSLKFLNIQS